jgi:hypothetical protein
MSPLSRIVKWPFQSRSRLTLSCVVVAELAYLSSYLSERNLGQETEARNVLVIAAIAALAGLGGSWLIWHVFLGGAANRRSRL